MKEQHPSSPNKFDGNVTNNYLQVDDDDNVHISSNMIRETIV